MTGLDGRTAVRHRNGAAILDAAIDVLTADPQAGMGEIAAAAGVGRATLYRHYPAREDLVDALADRVRAAFVALLAELESAAEPDLEHFVDRLFRIREGMASIAPQPTPDDARVRALWEPMLRVIVRLQEQGTINADLGPEWVLVAFRGLLRAGASEVDAGRLNRGIAAQRIVCTFLVGVSPASGTLGECQTPNAR